MRFIRAHPLEPELLYAIKYFLKQRGPTTSELWAILQKRDNSRSTSNQIMHRMDRTTDAEQFKLKKGRQVSGSLKQQQIAIYCKSVSVKLDYTVLKHMYHIGLNYF